MGGNDTHDKHGRPYELDDSKDDLYNRLEEFREAARNFRRSLERELEDCVDCEGGEFGQTNYILEDFDKYFSGCDF